ncbi:uncharacterized protein LOC130692190 [Daphnia carinata]|uniref:uncharacterized protein LOC130692190 n=1 Tax=Daphnia carinata TaxID=120202 RepID=UPI002868EEA2|nr:uncharacterized protein LOC130692190 [Daphnia carinata]
MATADQDSSSEDAGELLIPCRLQDQCRCFKEEENVVVTNVYLKHGKIFKSNHSEPDCCDNPESARCSNSVLGDANFDENEIIKTTKKNNQQSTKVESKRNSKLFISSLNDCIFIYLMLYLVDAVDSAFTKKDLLQLKFQVQFKIYEDRIAELKLATDRVKTSKEKGKSKSSKSKESTQHITIIESKIEELETLKITAQIYFERASSFMDSDIRKKRELFRLNSPLPALSKRQDFEKSVCDHQFVVVMGQTGSGKSTQLTQYLADMPQFQKQIIICTQPRKIAALTLTQRVAFEFAAGEETLETKKWVGYHVGGDNQLHLSNRIQYMTETVLLNQLTQAEVTKEDPFRNCGAVIVDEAHSRTITTDVLLGVLKRKIHLWPHLKVIVTSATIDTSLFSKYLNDCPVIEIPGRLFPVEVIYRPFDRDNTKIVDAVVKQAIEICNGHQSGDVLCFLTGQNEVEWATQKFSSSIKINASKTKKIVAYSLYGKQTPEEQQKVFHKTPDVQKVIFSTDIAETSITIDGVKFIVDSGLTKNLIFDSARNITSLKEMMISSASAEQRKGRAGRTATGTCYRLYSEDVYNAMAKYDKAEIFLRPLSITVTLLKAMRVDPRDFHWLEKPDTAALEAAEEELNLLGALDHQENLTPLGHLIGDLQIDPGIAHMIYYACSKGLGKEATLLAGLFSVTSMVFWRGGDDENRQASDEAKKHFFTNRGDILTSHLAFMEWLNKKKADRTLKTAKAWCMENFINNKAMNMASSTSEEIQLHLLRNARQIWRKANQDRKATDEELQQLIAQAFILNVAYRVNRNYVGLRADTMTYIHPGSVFFDEKELPQVITYQSILRTSKTYATQLTPIDMEWIREENGALYALYEEMASQVNIKEIRVTPVSRGILHFILGPANRNLDELNQELDCLVHGDYKKDALVAWCKPNAVNFVYSELTRKVASRKRELELEIREDPVIGETRIVWGCGGEARLLLFRGNYIGLNFKNVPNAWSLLDVDMIIRQKCSQFTKDSVRNLFFLSNNAGEKTKTARVVFDDPQKASAALKELSAGGGLQAKLEFFPALSNYPSVYKESEAWLNITFAIAPSRKSAIVLYSSLEDANHTIRNSGLNFRPTKFSDTQNNALRNHCPKVDGGLFIKQANPFNVTMRYGLYANRLPANFDEVDLERHLARYGCQKPLYAKIVRGAEGNSISTQESTLLLNYAKSNQLFPFSEKAVTTIVRKDDKRKTISIRARYESMDQIEMIYVSQLCANLHYDQPVRMKAQIKTSVRMEKKLWEFRQQEIENYLELLKTKDVTCKLETKSEFHVWLHLEVPRAGNIDEVRKKIDDFLQFEFYKNADIELLFTHYGRKQVAAVDVRPCYLNSNFTTKAIRIYGNERERQTIKGKLDALVRNLKLLCIDVTLIVRKPSLKLVTKNLTTYRNNGLKDELRLSYNRLYATGTEEGIEMLKNVLKNHVIEPRNEIDIGECGLCFTELVNPTCLQMCAHKFCSECIQNMVTHETIPYPIVCPADGCNTKVCLKDIQTIAPVSVQEKIGEAAVNALRRDPTFKEKYRSCFKTGCEQYIPITKALTNEKEQVVSGGDAVFCDQCNLYYCCTCSTTLKKPVERHRGATCSERQLGENKDVRWHRLYILDELCLLRCPRCRTAFIDFDGCCALWCSIAHCKAAFCFFCLEDCGRDAHSHVRDCQRNPSKGTYHINASKKNTVHKESRKRTIVQYLMKTIDDRGLRSSVLHSIEKDLRDLEIVISPSEVNLVGFTPFVDTAKHRKHILDEICTLRCPGCHTAFFDYEGCSAIQCWNPQCKTHFCFFCFEDCGPGNDQKNHAHVIKCPKNIVPGQLHTPSDKIDVVNCKRRKEGIIAYLMSHCSDVTERQAVIDSVSVYLKELKVVITHEDLLTRVEPIRPIRPPEPVRRVPIANYHAVVPPQRLQPAEPVRHAPVLNYYRVVPPRPLPAEPYRRAPNLNFNPIVPPPPPRAENRERRREENKCVFL